MKKTVIKETTNLELYTHFSFSYIENATNVGMALAQSGYFINIIRDGTGYRLDVYKRA